MSVRFGERLNGHLFLKASLNIAVRYFDLVRLKWDFISLTHRLYVNISKICELKMNEWSLKEPITQKKYKIFF